MLYDWNKARETVRRNWRCREGGQGGVGLLREEWDDKWKVEF